MKDKLRKALDQAKRETAQARSEFEEARKAASDAGVDLSVDGEAFTKLDELNRHWSEKATVEADLEHRYIRVLEMEDGEQPKRRPLEDGDDDRDRGRKALERFSPGARVVESEGYKKMVESGVLELERAPVRMEPAKAMDRAELKALITGLSDTSAGAFVLNDRLPGMLELLQRPRRVAQLVTVGETDSDLIEWVKQDSFTNAAAETAEATSVADGAKPESTMAFSVVQSNVQNIAHYLNVTRRALADAAQLRTLIDSQMELGIELRLDSQMVNGNGTAPNLRGILNTAGIASQARGADARSVAIYKAITQIRLAFLEPSAILLHPNDWQDVRLEQDANGNFYYGPLSTADPVPQLGGIPVLPSPVIAEGTGLVGDFRQAYLWIREGIVVLTSENVNDFFLRNIITLLAEGRFGFTVPRPAAFAQVTGL